ncbi:Gfo/Idh/MocA family protein [candidate division KSB1 bacterium]
MVQSHINPILNKPTPFYIFRYLSYEVVILVKIGVIGAGKWGVNHIRSLSKLDCGLVGLADPDPKKEDLAKEHNIKFFKDYKKMLPLVDAVTIVVPTDLHYDVVKDCLENGKHVLVEKPITLVSERAKELVELARSKNLILSVGYLFRFNNSVKRLKELMKDVGKVQYINGRYIHSSKPPRKDSGAIINLSLHLIDVLNFILEKRAEKIYCKKKNLLSEKFEDSAIMILDYGDFTANLEVSCCHPLKKRDMWIIAEKEKIYIDFFEQEITRYPLVVSYENIERKDEIKENIENNEPLKDELKHFCEVVAKAKSSNEPMKDELNIGKEEYYTTRICELALKSAEEGKELEIR